MSSTKPRISKSKIVKNISNDSIVKGSYLTVIKNPDRTTSLIWDDESLLKEVQNAILSWEQQKEIAIKPKSKITRKKKP